jgi:hypothetical protein
MKNFARQNSTEKKTWGVLGKIQTYEIPNNAKGKEIVPLNNNAFASWDSTKSNYRIRPHMPQQGGVVSVDVTPTPTATAIPPTPTPTLTSTPTPTLTSTSTPTPTLTSTSTPTPTPSSTPTPTPTSTPIPFDVDAQAYLNAVITSGGTVNSTMSAATNTLFVSLKDYDIYNDLLVFYPILGGTADSTKLNGKRTAPQFDIEWSNPGAMTFDSSGVLGNTAGGGNTFIVPDTDLTLGNRHMSFYSNLVVGGAAGYEIGGGDGVTNTLIVSYGGGTGYFAFGPFNTYANTSSTGFYYTQVSGATSPYNMVGYKNGVQVVNTTSTDLGGAVYTSLLCDNRTAFPGFNSGVERSNKRVSWASFGNDLTPIKSAIYENIVNEFQTTLGRNTYVSPIDVDAQAYIDDVIAEGGTITPTVSAATDTLFTSLKFNNLYSKIALLYPMLGGIANSSKLEAKGNTSYNMTWTSGVTFSSSGATGNGTDGYGSTGWIQNTNSASFGMGLDDASAWVYIQNVVSASNKYTFGSADSTRSFGFGNSYNGFVRVGISSSIVQTTTFRASVSAGFAGESRTGSTNIDYYWTDSSSASTIAVASSAMARNNMDLFRAGTIGGYTQDTIGTFGIGQGLSNSEFITLRAIIIEFNQAIGR